MKKEKIALFTNVDYSAVISAIDVDSIYKIPLLLNEQNLDGSFKNIRVSG